VAKMNIKTMAWSFAESRSRRGQSTVQPAGLRTVARREDILVLGVLADWQVVVLAKLLVAVQTSAVALPGVAFADGACRR
jgi:hypothetical protein